MNITAEDINRIIDLIASESRKANDRYIMSNPCGEIPLTPLTTVKTVMHPTNKEHVAKIVLNKLEEVKKSTARLKNFFGILKQVEPKSLAIFGGAVRDWWLLKQPKDIDIVVNCPKEIVSMLAANFDYQKSQFDGYQFTVDGVKIDVWRLQDSWAFRHKGAGPASWEGLLKNVPFNIDGVLVFGDGNVMENGFFEGMNNRQIELVNPINKNPAVNITQRAMRFKEKYGFALGPKLQAEMSKHKLIDFSKIDKVQTSGSSN